MKSSRTILILSGILVFLLLFVVIVDMPSEKFTDSEQQITRPFITGIISENISKIEIKRKGKVRKSKLYYLRKKKGRAAVRVKDRQ